MFDEEKMRRLERHINAQFFLSPLVTFCVTMLVIHLLYGPLHGRTSDAIALPAFFLAFFGTYYVTYHLLAYQRWNKEPKSQSREELESLGLITVTTHRATRALYVEQSEDEGISYFLEIEDGHVLFLTGQYLDEYEYFDEDEEERVFPSNEFTLKRNIKSGEVLDLEPAGEPFEPEDSAPPFAINLRDGEIIWNRSFDEIKKERMDEPETKW